MERFVAQENVQLDSLPLLPPTPSPDRSRERNAGDIRDRAPGVVVEWEWETTNGQPIIAPCPMQPQSWTYRRKYV